eukprot:TRINITY_DN5741_c0_g1_i1.p1 TRINITY_DN5741_c0_g1~~TRINITY_DN5741_c0_g1_i1.p1  ORF type:complete len:295 (-),score=66.18 TRINITY_DN5741_c0_g1_i1:238-1122(-)
MKTAISRLLVASALVSSAAQPVTEGSTVLVTGATGKTGALTYKRLKAEGFYNVRAFVRNATKAKDTLGCEKCDESEGVFVGDLHDSKAVAHVMEGVNTLVVVTASTPRCTGIIPFGPFNHCEYVKGGTPKDIDWEGTKAQVSAFAAASGVLKFKHLLFVSSGMTTVPDNFLDKIANGQNLFYKLNAEAAIMSSGLPYTIVKPCGLTDTAAGKKKLIIGHDDEGFSLAIDHAISRDDVARILVEAIKSPAASTQTRFDVCSHFWGAATTNVLTDVIKASYYKWDPRAKESKQLVV